MHMKEVFAPALRSAGFKGSGQNFLRKVGESVHAVNIQGSKYGDEFFVNLGLHYAFLPPCWCEALPPNRKFKERDCEFRWRLSPPSGAHKAWHYGSSSGEALKQVESLLNEFERRADPVFQQFATPAGLASALTMENLANRSLGNFPFSNSATGYALALARIHAHLGNVVEAARFAEFGLLNLGGASAHRAPLERLAGTGMSF